MRIVLMIAAGLVTVLGLLFVLAAQGGHSGDTGMAGIMYFPAAGCGLVALLLGGLLLITRKRS